MADPVGVAFAPGEPALGTAPAWVQLDSGTASWTVSEWTVSRGRASELDKTPGGSATITIHDQDGSFDPSNTGGPFYGELDPMTQAAIRFENPVTAELRYLFKGWISEFPTDMHKTTRVSVTELELVDGFDIFNGLEMAPTHHGTTTPTGSEGDIYFPPTTGTAQVQGRLNFALDQVGWPAEWRHIFSGNVDLQGVIYARRESLLNVLQDAADAEFPGVANVFMSRRGTLVFRGRYARFSPEDYEATDDDLREGPAGIGGRIRFWTAGGRPETDSGTADAYISDLSWRRSKLDVINAALALPNGVSDTDVPGALYKDDTSTAQYGWRSVSFENLLVEEGNTPPGQTAVEECELFAEYYVENFKQPKTRITRLVFRGLPLEDPAAEGTWALICGVEIGDVITVRTSHFGTAGGFDEDYFVEGIRYTCRPAQPEVPDMTLELDVSPRGFYSHNPWGTAVPGE